MDSPQTNANSSFSTWKAIADYLGVTIRTAQRYESEFRLPVHRMPGEKGRVWAHPAELDAWVQSQHSHESAPSAIAAEPEPAPEGSAARPRRHRLALTLAVAFVVIAAIVISSTYRFQPQHPIQFRADGNALVALDSHNRECWRFEFPHPPLAEMYSVRSPSMRRWQEADLDGDNRSEVLLQYSPSTFETLGTTLYCLTDTGRLRWTYRPVRQVRDARGSFSTVYYQSNLAVVNRNATRRPLVVMSANHATGYPNVVSVLDAGGALVSEYWHSGHLRQLALADLNEDGIDEVLLAGANVGERRATLVVLDLASGSGASHQPAGDWHQLQGFAPASEKAVILFPSSCIALHEEFTIVSQIRVTDDRISLIIQQDVFEGAPYYLTFDLDHQFNVLNVTPSDTYMARHRELEIQGIVNHSFNIKEVDALKEHIEVRRRGF